MSTRAAKSSERGAVIVMVAIWLPVLALFASFAIDISHFFDYSRNLQNRADAAALAAGQEFGGTCFGTYAAPQTDPIGKTAQQYSGPPNGTPSPGGIPNGTNLPYAFNSATPYQNQPNLTKGTPANFHVLLNSTKNWDAGGTNWSMGSDAAHRADSTAICSSTDENGKTGPMVDVRVTQANLGLFFPLLGFTPNISAHARVQLEGAGGTNSIPIAVPDPAQTPCLRAEVINDLTGTLVKDANGNPIDVPMTPPNPNGTPPQPNWTVTLPAMTVPAAQLSVQAYIQDDCAAPGYPSGGALYDASNGLEFINTFTPLPAGDPATAAIGPVYLTPAGCDDPTESSNQDAYFYYFPNSTTNGCSVTVCANVKFSSSLHKTEVDVSMDGAKAQKMSNPSSNCGPGANSNTYSQNFAIPSESGRHTFTLSWNAQGNAGGNFNGGNPLQATYSAFQDGSVPPDDSGPVTQAFIGDNTGAIAGVDSLQQGTSKTLTVAFHLQGLELAKPSDPPIILRTAVQNRKATGAFDCGQGTGASALYSAIVNGCPDPAAIYSQAQGCVFYTTATPFTCANLVPGNRRNMIDNAFQDRISAAVDNGQASPCDAWQAYASNGTSISGFEPWNATVADPRIIVMVVTAPSDLSGGGGPTNSVKVLGFATFYVTGYDGDPWLPTGKGKGNGTKIPNCSSPINQDDAYPGSGTDKDQIWGHFIKYVAVGGSSNGQPCNLNDVSVCVAALTR